MPFYSAFHIAKKSCKSVKILLVHQFLWAHYKAAIFSRFQKLVDKHPNIKSKILQTALYEEARVGFGTVDRNLHNYNYELVFDNVYERVPLFSRFWETLRRVRQFKPNVVNLPGYYEPAMVLVQLYCRIIGIKVILSVDSTESDNANVWYKEIIKRFIISQANGFFCYGTLAADYMLKLGAKPNQILMRNNAVDNEVIRQIHDRTEIETLKNELGITTNKNFIYVGRLMKIKNIQRLLDAYQQLNSTEWSLLLVGNGEDKAEILTHIQSNHITNVHFISAQPWQEVPRYMALADVLVLPSYSEPWGLVVNEAMACGKAVVVSEKCGCAPDLVKNGVNGFTFNPFNVEQLQEKLHYFIANPEAARSFGNAGQQMITKFHPLQVAEEMLAGFQKVCKK